MLRHATVVRPIMSLANLDIKTAFDEAKSEARGPNFGQPQHTLMADCNPSA